MVAGGLAARLRQRGALRGGRRHGLLQRQLVAVLVDHEQHLPAPHTLVVLDEYLRHQPRDIGRDLHHVGAYVAIARPWRHGVVIPQMLAHEERGHGGQQGQQHGNQQTELEFHDCSQRAMATTPPSTMT